MHTPRVDSWTGMFMAGTGHEGLKPEPTGSVDWGNRVQGRRAKGTADSSQRAGLSGRRSRISLLQDAVSQPRRKEGGHSRHEDQQMHWQLPGGWGCQGEKQKGEREREFC